MSIERTSFAHEAIVLAAGNGDRFQNESPRSKLLTPVAGVPLLLHTLQSAWKAGITDAHVVLGYDADSVRMLAMSGAPDGLHLHFHLNRDWHQENGLSVLAARHGFDDRPFALMMGDHIFEPRVLERLLNVRRLPGEALLGIDRHTNDPEIAFEATKVRLRGDRVVAIGKSLDTYDALDTGLFACDRMIFAALDESCASGDSTLSGGIRRLAARGLVRGVDVGDARWCDIDTVADLTLAEELLAPVRRV
jgi:1L-myo-inositol 1-phosphate cytidylyltransferase / CDP-L-myo-inositol myo-inositolphosphotransferase